MNQSRQLLEFVKNIVPVAARTPQLQSVIGELEAYVYNLDDPCKEKEDRLLKLEKGLETIEELADGGYPISHIQSYIKLLTRPAIKQKE